MKVISYNPAKIENISCFMNEYLKEFKNEKYLMFVFDEVANAIIDKNDLVHKYEELLEKLDLPYAFFSYYAHFNKILPNLIAKPAPRITVKMKDGYMFDVVQEPSFGLLVLNVEKLNKINFLFDETFKTAFYVQDLVTKCYDNKAYFSETYFIDVHNSFELFNTDFRKSFMFDAKVFTEEKKIFFELHKNIVNEPINDYVNAMKARYTVIEPEVINKEEEKK